ncbi:hypothetical protein K440DRAFT_659429 [Wilcoxina mikolae CBS 423.85]|nr:hypothetical protein K440DRAFT_659429 [Wilcoxina mikolae CBS 423.85]
MRREDQTWWKAGIVRVDHGWYQDTASPDTYIFTFKTTFWIATAKFGEAILELAERGFFRFEIGKIRCRTFFDVVRSAPLDFLIRIDFACSVSTSQLEHGGCSQTVSLVATVPPRFEPGLQTLEPCGPEVYHKWDTRLLIAAKEGSDVLRVYDQCQLKSSSRYYGPYGCTKPPSTWPLGIGNGAHAGPHGSPAFSEDSGIGDCNSGSGSLTSRYNTISPDYNGWGIWSDASGDSYALKSEQSVELPPFRCLIQPTHDNTASFEGQTQPKFGNDRRILGFPWESHIPFEDNTKYFSLEGANVTTFQSLRFQDFTQLFPQSEHNSCASTSSVISPGSPKIRVRRGIAKRSRASSSSRSSISSRSSNSGVSTSDVDSAIDLRSARNTVSPEDRRETKQNSAKSVSPKKPRQPRKNLRQGTFVCPVCKEKFKASVELRSHQKLTKHTMQSSQSTQKSGRGGKDGSGTEAPTSPENTANKPVGNAGAKLDIALAQTPRVYTLEQDDEIPLSGNESNRDQISRGPSSADRTCETRTDSGDSACGADSPLSCSEYYEESTTGSSTKKGDEVMSQAFVTLFGDDPNRTGTTKNHNCSPGPSCYSLPSTPAQSPYPVSSSLPHLQQHHGVSSPSLATSPQAPMPSPNTVSIYLPDPNSRVYSIPTTSQSPAESKNRPWGSVFGSEGVRTVETPPWNWSGTEYWRQNIPTIHSIDILETPGGTYGTYGSSTLDVLNRSTALKRPLALQSAHPEKDEPDRHLEPPPRRTSVSMTDSSISTNSTPAKSDKLGTPFTALTTPQTVSDMGNAAESPLVTRSPAEHTSARGINTGFLPNVFSRTGSHARVWIRYILPWVNSNFDKIMGEENAGAIEFLMLGPDRTPTVCITVEDEAKVNHSVLDSKLSQVEVPFEVKIQQGDVERTGGNNRPAECYEWPSLNSEFQPLPSCGASIGVGSNTGTFGGLVQLKLGNEWKVFGLTSHHLFENRTKDTPIGKGVNNGEFDGATFEISQPSQHHLQYSIELLERSLQTHVILDKRSGNVSSPAENQHMRRITSKQKKITRKLEEQKQLDGNKIKFGRVVYSSGFGRTVDIYPDSLAEEMARSPAHTMDWALFGDIPNERSMQVNCFSKALTGAFYEDGDPITTTASAQFFEGLNFEEFDYPDPKPNVSPPEPYCRVHGVGAMTGLQDGYLSTVLGCIKLEKYGSPSIEWSFAPRDPKGGLGKRGDSGAWIFDDFGSVVGMILGRNDRTGLTYFTPIDAIFKDIKKTLGFEVRLAKPSPPSRDALLSHDLEGAGGGVSLQHSLPQSALQSTPSFPAEDFYTAPEPWNELYMGYRNNPSVSLMLRPEPPYPDFGTPGICTPNSQRDSAIGIPCTPVDNRKRKNSEACERTSKRPTMTPSQSSFDSSGWYDVHGREGFVRIKREPED